MIKLEGISKTYAKSANKAVDQLSLEIQDGEIFGFLGPNGAGKTTTIRIMTGALGAFSGKIEIDGVDLATRNLEAKSRFGYVGDNPELFSRLRAYEYLNFIADMYRVPDAERRERTKLLAERFGIDSVLASPIGSFSRGMKQKLCVVASLLHDPSNWILDEPMVGLDPQAAFDLKEIMRERSKAGKTVFFSTHVMEVAEKLCDRIAVIDRGQVIFVGKLEELREKRSGGADESLESLFLRMVGNGEGGQK
jgi:ABC-2 type transport system ATP-binding protein